MKTKKCNECLGSGKIGQLHKVNGVYKILAYSKCLMCAGKGQVTELKPR